MRANLSSVTLLLLYTVVHAAAAAETTLGPVAFDAPGGWTVASRGDAARVLAPPADAVPAGKEAVVLVLLTDAADLNAGFGAVVEATRQDKKVLESSELRPIKTRQGHPALSQSLTLQDDGGGRILGDFIGVQLDGRVVTFCFLATDAALHERLRPAFMALVGNARFGQAAPPQPPPAAPRKVLEPPPIDKEAYARQADARRKPRTVLGVVTTAAGKPLKDARVSIDVRGTTLAGERSVFTAQVDEDGRYELLVPDGVYTVWPTCRIRFDGQTIPLQLEPLDGKPYQTSHPSRDGIVKDYRLRLTGLRPGRDADKADSYYGAVVNVRDDSVDGNNLLVSHYPQGTTFQLTLTPKTPAVDGTELAPVVLECPLSRVSVGGGIEWGNVPIARYAATARVVMPDGKTKALNLSHRFNQGFAATQEVAFRPLANSDALEPATLYVWD